MPLLLMTGASSNTLNISPSNIANFDVNHLTPQSVTVTGGLPPYTASSNNGEVCSVTQGTSPNIVPNADSFSGWTISNLTSASGGPLGATDLEYTGTGSNISANLEAKSPAIAVVPGNTYYHSWWFDPSNITHGGVDFRILKASDSSVLVDTGIFPTGSPARIHATAWTCPAGVTSVYIDLFFWNGQSGGFIVANGQKLKISQPMLALSTVDPNTYLSPTSVFTVTPIYRGSATITYSDSTP